MEEIPKAEFNININVNAKSKSRAAVLYNSLRVELEPSKDVKREHILNEENLTINLSSNQMNHLKPSIKGVLDNIQILLKVIDKFEVTPEYNYDHF